MTNKTYCSPLCAAEDYLATETMIQKVEIIESITCNFNSSMLTAFCKYLVSLRKKRYYFYLITFTLKPSVRGEEIVEKYIYSQARRSALRIKEAHIVKERTKKGVAHWHMSVQSDKFIAKNRFNYYVQNYGSIDISKTKCQSISESLNYINKDNKSVILIKNYEWVVQ